MTTVAGPLLFVRYAYPPNRLGYCGPADSAAFREYGMAGVVDGGLVRLAQAFAGAWPYLELIAAGTGIRDPLDRRVVEAYWVGNRLLDAIPLGQIATSMEDRFRSRVGAQFGRLVDGVLQGAVPHHSFHVFGVYPWVGLLGDDRKAPHALTVLDRCRIRWGQVTGVSGASLGSSAPAESASLGSSAPAESASLGSSVQVTVRCRPLRWDGRTLSLGDPVTEVAESSVTRPDEISVGDWVSLHWNWVCDRLTDRQLRALRGYTVRHLALVNDRVALV